MDIDDLIATLVDNDVSVYVENEELVCEYKKSALNPSVLSLIKKYKSELMAYYQTVQGDTRVGSDITQACDDGNGTVLSFSQQRLWFLNEYEQGKSIVYNIPWAESLTGPLNITALEKSLGCILQRHDILRTVYGSREGESYQIVMPYKGFQLPVSTITASQVDDYIQAHAEHVFDLTSGPLFNFSLLRLADDQHILLFNIHHIAMDAWSVDILMNELSTLYSAYIASQSNPLSPLAIQYRDYACWQRQLFKGQALSALTDYWLDKLANSVELLQLPTDRLRPVAQTYNGSSQDLLLCEALTDKLRNTARLQNVTLFMLILSAFKVLLYRYAQQSDIIVGVPALNRQRPELENIIGFFANTLVFRSLLDGNASYAQLLQQIKITTLEAYENQDVPFEYLVEALNPVRSLSYSPIFQVLFAMQDDGVAPFSLPGITPGPLNQPPAVTAKFDLSLFCIASDNTLRLSIEYNTDLFDRATIQRWLHNYKTLLCSVVHNTEQRLSQVAYISADEREQLLRQWNNTDVNLPDKQPVHQLFVAQAARTPDAIAVTCAGQQLTYRCLNERSNQLAHGLLDNHVSAPGSIGMLIEPSPDRVIALLAVIKAGLTCVPLDYNLPAARLRLMIELSHVSIVLTHSTVSTALPVCKQVTLICADHPESVAWLKQYPVADTALRQKTTTSSVSKTPDTVCIIYSSNLAAKPRGVVIRASNLINGLLILKQVPGIDSAACFLATTACFTLHHWFEVLVPLSAGARLLITSAKTVTSAVALMRLIDKENVSCLQALPAILKTLINHNWRAPANMTVLSCADKLGVNLKNSLINTAKVDSLWNMYGATQSSACSSIARQQAANQSVIISPPVAHCQHYILDAAGQLLPIGVTGELYVAGACLSCGYLGLPQLTAERFVSNPFSDQHKSRLYRTGDLCRRLSDGSIVFVDTVAAQINLQGIRIESGTVEDALLSHQQVADVAVRTHNNKQGERFIVAYIVLKNQPDDGNGRQNIDTELNHYLAARLPDYMRPAFYITLASMPLTSALKIDKSALEAPDPALLNTLQCVPPSSETEKILAQIWADVLDVAEAAISIHDNFFALQGHSLKAVKVAFRIVELLGVEISLNAIFEFSTLAELATHIDTMLNEKTIFKKPLANNALESGEL